ncbi:restriction endonuclease [Streptomyces sp. NPDC051219]|uniref:restriction endonuclease n=1 Tax=Streptomyces sp. NPDC051219 TaxID=3155283 RepID=UPI003419B22E
MARKKSLAAQLMQAYRDAQKAKSAELKRQQQEQDRLVRAAEQERLRREREKAKQEREQAQAWARAHKEKKRLDTEEARRAQQVVLDLEKRQAAREREAEQRKRDSALQAAEAARIAKQRASEQLRGEAVERTAAVQEQVEQLQSALLRRPQGLHVHRIAVEEALLQDGPDGLMNAVDGALAQVVYPAGLRGVWRSAFAPETRQLLLEIDLPGQDVVPTVAQYRYKASAPPAVVPQPRKEAEVKELYRTLVARLALRAIDEAFAVTPPSLVDVVAFNGHAHSKDRATGKAIRPCLVSVRSSRETFEDLVLDEPELDPVQCLRHLNAVVSQHPYDLEPVRPVVTFDLKKYKLAPEVDVVAGLDSRPDLVVLDPIEFEHLIRRLFEEIGLKAWVTQASRDDGVDAVATNEDPIIGGLCIIQAKRTKNTVPAEAVRALAGVMHDKAAAKGILVTTAWYGKASHDFAQRTGRMELIDGRGLKALLLEHLGIDALIGLPKLPPGWDTRDLS